MPRAGIVQARVDGSGAKPAFLFKGGSTFLHVCSCVRVCLYMCVDVYIRTKKISGRGAGLNTPDGLAI